MGSQMRVEEPPTAGFSGGPPAADHLAILFRLTNGLFRARHLGDVFDAALDAITSGPSDRASILLFDEGGAMQFVAWRGLSDDYRSKLAGHSPWTPADTHPAPVLVKDIDETDEPDWVKTAIKAEGIRALAFIPLVSRGRTIGKFMSYFPDVHEFPESEVELAVTIARQLGFGIERARADEERQRGIDELRESEERFRLMSEQAPVMIWTSDAEGRCLHLNRLLREFWGVEDLSAFDWQRTMHPDDAAEIGRQMMQAISDQEAATIDGRYLNADGTYRILRTEARPRFSPIGTFLGMIGVNVDITERQESERRLRLLLDELNHRVKNTLAVVQAMAHQSFRDSQADKGCVRCLRGTADRARHGAQSAHAIELGERRSRRRRAGHAAIARDRRAPLFGVRAAGHPLGQAGACRVAGAA